MSVMEITCKCGTGRVGACDGFWPVGWYYEIGNGLQGPFESREAAEIEAYKRRTVNALADLYDFDVRVGEKALAEAMELLGR